MNLRLKSAQYKLINGIFFRINHDGVLLRFLEKDDANNILKYLHDGPIGNHYTKETIAHKILRVRYYWPMLFNDATHM